jgi:hypothetical protein
MKKAIIASGHRFPRFLLESEWFLISVEEPLCKACKQIGRSDL